MDISLLEELGLSNAEAKIYLALLKLGSATTGNIITATKLQSSTVYHVLGTIVEKGMVTFIYKGKIKYYQAESPETLLAFLEEKKRKFTEILPELKRLEKARAQKQSAQVYQGINGLKAAFNDVILSLKPGEEYHFFQIPKEKLLNEQIILFLRNYHLKRAEKGIKVKGLALKGSEKRISELFKGIKHSQIRYIDEFTPSGIIIYKNKVITLDWEETPTAFVIQSDAVAESYRRFFEQKWNQAKP